MTEYINFDSGLPLHIHHEVSETCHVDIHIHDKYEIFQALTDNIKYFVEGRSYILNKNDIVITSNNEIHRPTTIDSGPYGRRFIQFTPLIVQTYDDTPFSPLRIFENRKKGILNHLPLPTDALPFINEHFESIRTNLDTNTPRGQYAARLALTSLLMDLDNLFDDHAKVTSPSENMDPRIYPIRRYLDQHYTEAFNLDAISDFYHMDKYYLSHLFKENTGFTLLEYVQSKRMMLAKTLLDGDLTINEISQQCGYKDYSNFFKTFKKLLKMSPNQYRNR